MTGPFCIVSRLPLLIRCPSFPSSGEPWSSRYSPRSHGLPFSARTTNHGRIDHQPPSGAGASSFPCTASALIFGPRRQFLLHIHRSICLLFLADHTEHLPSHRQPLLGAGASLFVVPRLTCRCSYFQPSALHSLLCRHRSISV